MKNKILRLSLPAIIMIAILLGTLLGGVAAFAHEPTYYLNEGDNLIQCNHNEWIYGTYWYSYWASIPIYATGYNFDVDCVINSNGDSNYRNDIKYGIAWMWAAPGTAKTIWDFQANTVYGSYIVADINQQWYTGSYPLQYQQQIRWGTSPFANDFLTARR
jgi:hypothetical protein